MQYQADKMKCLCTELSLEIHHSANPWYKSYSDNFLPVALDFNSLVSIIIYKIKIITI